MIYIGSDHGGYRLKETIKKWLVEWQFEFTDLGADSYDPNDDYPDYAKLVGQAVAKEEGARGILICRSGIGIAVAANKIKGVRAGTVTIPAQADVAVKDEDMNILALPADYIDEETIKKIVEKYCNGTFSSAERHARRLEKIKALEIHG